MAQAVATEPHEGEVEDGIDLKEHLTKHEVAPKVYNLLQQESIKLQCF